MYSDDLKIRAINLYNIFKNYRYVASLLNIGKSTIHASHHCLTINIQLFIIKTYKEINIFIL